MNHYASIINTNISDEFGFSFDRAGKPGKRVATEEDIGPIDRRIEAQLIVIGKVCMLSLVCAFVMIVLTFTFQSPLALMGVALAFAVVAAVLRVGETQYKKYVAARQSGVAKSDAH